MCLARLFSVATCLICTPFEAAWSIVSGEPFAVKDLQPMIAQQSGLQLVMSGLQARSDNALIDGKKWHWYRPCA